MKHKGRAAKKKGALNAVIGSYGLSTMAEITIHWQGDGLARMKAAITLLAGKNDPEPLRRALNHTGDKAYTLVRRLIAQHTRVPVRMIDKYGAMKKRRAAVKGTGLEYRIEATGKGIPLKVFKAYQTRKGVTVDVWPKGRYLIPHAFIVKSLGGHVFWRTSKSRTPIARPTGPSIPKELVKKYVDEAFQSLVSRELPQRVEHEVRVITDGIVS